MKPTLAETGLRLALGAGVLLAGAYGIALAYIWWAQERLLFNPTPLPPDHPLVHEADVHEHWVDVPGARLNVLQLRRPQPQGVVFFLHGNSGNLENWFVSTGFYRELNLDLVMFDYRGYGKSTGRIKDEAQLLADVRAVWAAFAPQYQGTRLIVYGRSLGSGLAARFAADVQSQLTVLVSPYESMVALAREKYPFVPAALLRYPLRSDEALAHVRGPVLLLHGLDDGVIPPDHSRRLQRIRPDARLVLVPQAGHADIHRAPVYLDALRAACGPQSPTATPAPPRLSP